MTITAFLRGGPADGRRITLKAETPRVMIPLRIEGQSRFGHVVYIRRTSIINDVAIYEPETRDSAT